MERKDVQRGFTRKMTMNLRKLEYDYEYDYDYEHEHEHGNVPLHSARSALLESRAESAKAG